MGIEWPKNPTVFDAEDMGYVDGKPYTPPIPQDGRWYYACGLVTVDSESECVIGTSRDSNHAFIALAQLVYTCGWQSHLAISY